MELSKVPSAPSSIALLLGSVLLLPLSAAFLVFSYLAQILIPGARLRRRLRTSPRFRPKTVLVTGAGSAEGLRIARAMHRMGHNVIGADFEPDSILSHARFSVAIDRYYRLRLPTVTDGVSGYLEDLLHIVKKEKVDLWIPCSRQVSPIRDSQARQILEHVTGCTAFALDHDVAGNLATRNGFFRQVKSLGLPAPEVHYVKSRADVHNILNDTQGRKHFSLNSVKNVNGRNPKTLLPRRTPSQTYQLLAAIKISERESWVLEEQFVDNERYTTFVVILKGEVLAFAAGRVNPTSSTRVPTSSGVGKAMFQFVKKFAENAGTNFTGHLSIEFAIDEKATEIGLERNILPTACHLGPSSATSLFIGYRGDSALAKAYLAALSPNTNGSTASDHIESDVTASPKTVGTYSIGRDFVSLILLPLHQLLTSKIGLTEWAKAGRTCFQHVAFLHELTYERWDPLPLFALYHVCLPLQLAIGLFRKPAQPVTAESLGHVNGSL